MYRKSLIITTIALVLSGFFKYEKPSVDALVDVEAVHALESVKAKKTPTAAKLVAKTVKQAPTSNPVAVAPVMGDWVAQCKAWAAQAGVPLSNAAIQLIDRESDCNPCVVNGGAIDCAYRGERAFGIPQALPSYKTGCGPEPLCQIRWMQNYVLTRYGSWEAALGHSLANNWY